MLAQVFLERGLAEALDCYQALRRRDWPFRLASGAVESVLPLQHIGDELLRLDQEIGAAGLGPASRALLARWGLAPRYELPGETWRVLRDGPFLAIGNHVNGLEVAMFCALFSRPDVYHLAGSFVGMVGPHMSERILPLAGPGRREQRGGMRTWTLDRIEAMIWPAPSGSMRANLAVLSRAAGLVAEQGAGVQVFPTGSMNPRASWLAGVGHLAKQIARRQSAQRPVSLVFFAYGVRDAHLASSRLFARRPVTRGAARLLVDGWLGPPSVYASPPIPIGSLGITARTSPPAITALLHQRWLELEADARRAMPAWPRSALALRNGQRR